MPRSRAEHRRGISRFSSTGRHPRGASTASLTQTPIPLENGSGNYVTLDLGTGRFAFYEHLKHRSLAAKVGDRVRKGQVIGMLGNSGSSSSGPHLHFHVSDANATLAAEGVPFVFSSFEVLGAFPSNTAFASGQRWKEAPDGAGGRRLMELPFANTVISFGAGNSRPPK